MKSFLKNSSIQLKIGLLLLIILLIFSFIMPLFSDVETTDWEQIYEKPQT